MKLALIGLALASVAWADEPVYNVAGQITLDGNNNCAGLCIETVDFSFDMTYSPVFGYAYYPELVPGTMTISSSGPLGTFGAGSQFTQNYFPFYGGGAEIDLDTGFVPWATDGPPQFNGAWLWSCASATCFQDFTQLPPNSGWAGGLILPTDSSIWVMSAAPPVVAVSTEPTPGPTPAVNAVSVPEPSEMMLLVTGLIALAFYRRKKGAGRFCETKPN